MSKSALFIVLATLFIAYSHPLLAYPPCDEQIIGQQYYDIDKTSYELTRTQQTQLDSIIKRLDGEWQGKVDLTECKGTLKSPYRLHDSSTAKLNIKAHNTKRLKLHADLDFVQQNKKVLYNRKIFERRYINDLVANGPDIAIVTEKNYRQLQFSQGATLIETIYKIRFIDDQLQFDIINFSNGFFASEERWLLTRW